MKTEKISVNKTPDQPDGVEIEIVEPETDLEARVLSYLLPSILRDTKKNGRIEYDLPDGLSVQHQREGTFVVSASSSKDNAYYALPRPVAIVGLRLAGSQFDIVHAEIKSEHLQVQQPPPSQEPSAPPVPEPPAETATEVAQSDLEKSS